MSTKSCTPAAIPGFTIRSSNRGRRSAITSRPMSSAMCAASGRSATCPTFADSYSFAPGAVGQIVNLSSLGADAGVSHTTARQWLTILEASYVVFQLRPLHANIRKRLVKSPKLYFHDVGLAAHLVGVENARQVGAHPLRGPLFENAVVVEALKHRFNRAEPPNLSFFRDARGLECDLLCEYGGDLGAIEIKSGATIARDYIPRYRTGVRDTAADQAQGGRLRRRAPPGATGRRGRAAG